MNIFVIGAGHVGSTIVESLHSEHALTVIDLDRARLSALAYRFDARIVEGNGASRRTLQEAGIAEADLLIACTARDEPNIIAAMLTRKLAPRAKTIVRTTNVEYLEVWHEHQLDVDFIVCSEVEAALAVSRLIGVPAARQTDVFADGQVQIVEFDIGDAASRHDVIGKPLREAKLPPDSRVASIIRGGRMIPPFGHETIQIGDRVIIIGSPAAARGWSELIAQETHRVEQVVVFGGGRTGIAVARTLLEQGMRVRLIEPDSERAQEVAELLPDAGVLNATGFDRDFLARERIGQTHAAVVAKEDDDPTNTERARGGNARGLSRGHVDLAARARRRRLAIPVLGRAAAGEPPRRLFRVDVGVHDHELERAHRRRGPLPWDRHVAPVHSLARRDGDPRTRARSPAASSRRRPPAVRAGSIKVVRHVLIGKILRRELVQTVHPELVTPVRLNGVAVDERALRGVIVFVLLYVGCFALGALALTADAAWSGLELSPFEAAAAAATTLANTGPSFGFAGPMGSFEPFGVASKIVMTALMLLGRIEILPFAVLLTRAYWRP